MLFSRVRWTGRTGSLGLCLSFAQNRENFVFFFRASAPKFRETFANFLQYLTECMTAVAMAGLVTRPRAPGGYRVQIR